MEQKFIDEQIERIRAIITAYQNGIKSKWELVEGVHYETSVLLDELTKE